MQLYTGLRDDQRKSSYLQGKSNSNEKRPSKHKGKHRKDDRKRRRDKRHKERNRYRAWPCFRFFFKLKACQEHVCHFPCICHPAAFLPVFIPVRFYSFYSPLPTCLFPSACLHLSLTAFLGATKHLYNWLCPLVCRSVGLSVGNAFVRRSTRRTLLAYLALFREKIRIFNLYS